MKYLLLVLVLLVSVSYSAEKAEAGPIRRAVQAFRNREHKPLINAVKAFRNRERKPLINFVRNVRNRDRRPLINGAKAAGRFLLRRGPRAGCCDIDRSNAQEITPEAFANEGESRFQWASTPTQCSGGSCLSNY
jgi:hypothetical protein